MIRIISHLIRLKFFCHVSAHCTNLSRSSCKFWKFAIVSTCEYHYTSSALCCTPEHMMCRVLPVGLVVAGIVVLLLLLTLVLELASVIGSSWPLLYFCIL